MISPKKNNSKSSIIGILKMLKCKNIIRLGKYWDYVDQDIYDKEIQYKMLDYEASLIYDDIIERAVTRRRISNQNYGYMLEHKGKDKKMAPLVRDIVNKLDDFIERCVNNKYDQNNIRQLMDEYAELNNFINLTYSKIN